MAAIRRRSDNWQVQVRRKSDFRKSSSVTSRKDAESWVKAAEMEAERLKPVS
jgi:hypothetical protein